MAYDRTIVVFSPDGRLLQVEYARQMVKNGATAVGIKVNGAIILGGVKPSMELSISDSYKKNYIVDDHIALIFAGSLADTRDLVDMARVKSQINRITYNEPVSVSSLTKFICDRKHMVTQYAGVRPYGVGLLVGGVDDTGARLFETEPSGTMIEWKAQVIGRGADKAKKVLEDGYKESLSTENAIRLMIKALKVGEKKVNASNTEIMIVTKEGIQRVEKDEFSKLA